MKNHHQTKNTLMITGIFNQSEAVNDFSRPVVSVHNSNSGKLGFLLLKHTTQSGVSELLIMRDPHYERVCFKSVKTLGPVHA